MGGRKIQALKCAQCGVDWERPPTRGRKPKYCKPCTADPARVKVVAKESAAQRKADADAQAEALDLALKARGQHISQPRPRVSYSIAELVDRLNRAEARLDILEGRT